MANTPLIKHAPGSHEGKVRLQRVLADAGIAARRACEKLIEEGKVTVNGEVRKNLPVFVDPATDRIQVNGRPIARAEARHIYVMFHKPARTLTAATDEPGADRKTVVQMVKHPSGTRLFPVGRLSYDATGLVLLTNDGEMANRLTHPRYEVPRTYHALIVGTPDEATLSRLEREMHKFQLIENKKIGRSRAGRVGLKVIGRSEGKTVLEIVLREGANRQVEQALELAGYPVKALMQVTVGPIEMHSLGVGDWRELDRNELAALRRAVRDNAKSKMKEPLPKEERRPRRYQPGPRGNQIGPPRTGPRTGPRPGRGGRPDRPGRGGRPGQGGRPAQPGSRPASGPASRGGRGGRGPSARG